MGFMILSILVFSVHVFTDLYVFMYISLFRRTALPKVNYGRSKKEVVIKKKINKIVYYTYICFASWLQVNVYNNFM